MLTPSNSATLVQLMGFGSAAVICRTFSISTSDQDPWLIEGCKSPFQRISSSCAVLPVLTPPAELTFEMYQTVELAQNAVNPYLNGHPLPVNAVSIL